MFSAKWLPRYGLLANFTAEILHFGDVLDFDLLLHHLARTLEYGVMEVKLILHGTYGPIMNASLISDCQDMDF